MILREIEKELKNLSKEYPVVTILGPRQAGKTTLAKHVFFEYNYVNLELPDVRHLATSDPNAFFDRYKTPLIIDEIQRVPDLLSYIQVKVDEHNNTGDYILTGSNQFRLSQSVAQSLAGRTAILKLLPLTINELTQNGIHQTRDEYLANGFLPRIYDQKQTPYKAYGNYLETYIERDLRQQINIKNLTSFRIFLKLMAGRVGQVLNISSLSNDVGLSTTTLTEWLSVLEASYIIYKLPPYYNNYGKRLIKSPKIYFTEIGLVSYLLEIRNPYEATRDPLLGGLFENLVIMDVLKKRYNQGLSPNLYFFRDNHGHEIDLILEEKRKLIPIEIKAAMTFHDRFSKAIPKFRKLSGNSEKGFVIYAGELEFESEDYIVRNFQHLDLF